MQAQQIANQTFEAIGMMTMQLVEDKYQQHQRLFRFQTFNVNDMTLFYIRTFRMLTNPLALKNFRKLSSSLQFAWLNSSPKEFFECKFSLLFQNIRMSRSQCLKVVQKVAFNIASETSYVYILSGQKLIKNAKMVNFGEFRKTRRLRSNSVSRQVTFNRTNIGGKCQSWKIQMRHFV